jgi:replication fork clamp-binding protein CrfC
MKNQVNNSVLRNSVDNNTVIYTNEVYNPVADAVVKAMKTFGKSKNGCNSGYIQIDGDVRLCFDGGYFVNPSNGKYEFIFNGKIQVKGLNGRYNYELVKVHVFIESDNEINWNVQFNGVMNAIMEQIEKYNERIEELNKEIENFQKTVDVVEENNTIENDIDINVSENMPEESMDFISPDILNDVKSDSKKYVLFEVCEIGDVLVEIDGEIAFDIELANKIAFDYSEKGIDTIIMTYDNYIEKYENNNINMEIVKEQIKDVCTYALLNGRYTDWVVVAETLNKIIDDNPNITFDENIIETCKSLINKVVTYISICGPFSEVQIVDNLMRISKIYKIVDNWF